MAGQEPEQEQEVKRLEKEAKGSGVDGCEGESTSCIEGGGGGALGGLPVDRAVTAPTVGTSQSRSEEEGEKEDPRLAVALQRAEERLFQAFDRALQQYHFLMAAERAAAAARAKWGVGKECKS